MMPMIANTISNSIRVNLASLFAFMMYLPDARLWLPAALSPSRSVQWSLQCSRDRQTTV